VNQLATSQQGGDQISDVTGSAWPDELRYAANCKARTCDSSFLAATT